MIDIDTNLITELNVRFQEQGEIVERALSVTPKRYSWCRRLFEIIDDLAWDGAVPGSGAASDYRILSASVRLKGGGEFDVTDQLLREGWSDWLERDRGDGRSPQRHSAPERTARIRAWAAAEKIRIGATDVYGLLHSTPEYEVAEAAFEAACAAEDAAAALVAATWRNTVVEPVAGELVIEAAEPASEPVAVVEEPVVAAAPPIPANDTIDHAIALHRARSARDAAEAEERRAVEALLHAQEVRRQAQQDLDEVLATAELYSAPSVSDAGEDWDPRLGPDADEEAAEVRAHAKFVATLNRLEADDRLTDALAATDAAEAELWSAVSRAEAVAGAGAVAGIGAACRVLWHARQAERVASDVHEAAHDGRDRLAA